MARQGFGDMVKAVVDIKKEIIALGGEFHADGQELLVKKDSHPADTWGVNIYINKPKNKRIEFTALINIKPVLKHRSMRIQDAKLRAKIKRIIDNFIS